MKGPRYWPVEFQADTNWTTLRLSVSVFCCNEDSVNELRRVNRVLASKRQHKDSSVPSLTPS